MQPRDGPPAIGNGWLVVKHGLLWHTKSLLGLVNKMLGRKGLEDGLAFHARPLVRSPVACEAVYNSVLFLLSPFPPLYRCASPGIRCSLGAALRAAAAKGVPAGWY